MYSETLLELYKAASQRRSVAGWQRASRQENPVCGDVLELQARFDQGAIEELGFGGEGCPPLVAAAEWLCLWAPHRPIEEVRSLAAEQLEVALGGLPRHKRHVLSLCLDALEEICREVPQSV
ncbi:unnamed protein product [Phaeothamnion confervicola]